MDQAFQSEACRRICTDLSSVTCSCTQPSAYWSSSIQYQPGDPDRPDAAFGVSFLSGQIGGALVTTDGQFVRAVRGGPPIATPPATPTPRYVDNGDGTISDEQTGLTWEKKVTDFNSLHDVGTSYPWAGVCALNGAKYCQPTQAASAACTAGVQGDENGCAQCTSVEGTCSVNETIWMWVATLNAANFAGYADWRLPKQPELQSMVDYAVRRRPPVDSAFHGNSSCPDVASPACSRTMGDFYWSATSSQLDPAFAWSVWFLVGNSVGNHLKTASHYVRAVRGELRTPRLSTSTPTSTPTATLVGPSGTPTASARYVDLGDGTIVDTRTGLMWEKKDQGGGLHDRGAQYPWAGVCSNNTGYCQPDVAAADTCNAGTGGAYGCDLCGFGATCVERYTGAVITTIWQWLNQLNATSFAGYSDWRIPGVAAGGTAELETIFDPSAEGCGNGDPCISPAFNADCTAECTVTDCSCTQPNRYWSATSLAGDAGRAWVVNFFDDLGRTDDKTYPRRYVRAVRGGRLN